MLSWKIDSVHSMTGLRCEPRSGAGGAEGVGFVELENLSADIDMWVGRVLRNACAVGFGKLTVD